MTYYADLSPYEYLIGHAGPIGQPVSDCVNVGWLDARPFRRAQPTSGVIQSLWEHCKIQVARTRGIHCCPHCDTDKPIIVQREDAEWLLGTAEIRVFAADGQIFAAPNLIFHYVEQHHYKPPDVFVAALLGTCTPPRDEYYQRIQRLDPRWKRAEPLTREPERG